MCICGSFLIVFMKRFIREDKLSEQPTDEVSLCK